MSVKVTVPTDPMMIGYPHKATVVTFGKVEHAVAMIAQQLPEWEVRLSADRESIKVRYQSLNRYGLIVDERDGEIAINYAGKAKPRRDYWPDDYNEGDTD